MTIIGLRKSLSLPKAKSVSMFQLSVATAWSQHNLTVISGSGYLKHSDQSAALAISDLGDLPVDDSHHPADIPNRGQTVPKITNPYHKHSD